MVKGHHKVHGTRSSKQRRQTGFDVLVAVPWPS